MDQRYSVTEMQKMLKVWAEKGTLKKATAVSYNTAIDRVFSVLDDTEKLDVRKIDVESAIRRFQNLHESDVQPSSIRVYKSRIDSAIRAFVSYRDQGPNWKPELKTRDRVRSRSVSSQANGPPEVSSKTSGHSTTEKTTAGTADVLSYPFPLRNDVTVTVSGLPRDLTTLECFRLGAFLKTLAIDFDGK